MTITRNALASVIEEYCEIEGLYPFIRAVPELLDSDLQYSIIDIPTVLFVSSYGEIVPSNAGLRILNWIRLNPHEGIILHGPIISLLTDNHRFYFSNPVQAKAFRNWRRTQEDDDDSRIFEHFSPKFENLAENTFEAIELGGALKYSLPVSNGAEMACLYFWAVDNLKGSMYAFGDSVMFEHSADMMLFKMTFQGGMELELTLRQILDINAILPK